MIDYLVRHAIQNVWCTPDQDYQYIFKPARITRPRGVERQVDVEWDTITLPDNVSTFHVYQIGQLSPMLLNLIPTERKWYRITDACNTQNMVVNLYLNNGREFPRFDCYIQKTRTRNLIIAVKDQPRIGNLEKQALYVRFYSNAFFGSSLSQPTEDRIYSEGRYATDRESVLLFQRKFRDLREQRGIVNVYHNGWLVEDTIPTDVAEGDILEMVHDTSVYTTIDFPVSELKTFTSERDRESKYLLNRPKDGSGVIDYLDDVDIYLLLPKERGYEGIYFHKNLDKAVRMVTHRDYSIPVSHVVSYNNGFEHWTDSNELVVRVQVRRGGYYRPLQNVHHRIKELYRLSDADIERAMVGADSTVSVWKASELENSAYSRLMGEGFSHITRKLVQDTYGYNAISKILADTPSKVVDVDGSPGVGLPPALRQDATIYEYDGDGHLLGFYHHTSGMVYRPRYFATEMIEGIVGKGGKRLPTTYGGERVPYDANHNYRFYVCDVIGGIPSWNWYTAEKGLHYDIVGTEIVWLTDPSEHHTAVKDDTQFLAYEITLPPVNGVLEFSIEAEEQYEGQWVEGPLDIPFGELDIWMNGRSLIENLDYYVRWPRVTVVNKVYLEGLGLVPQVISVRATGFCQDDFSRKPASEVGFVEHGLLSRNNRFDVRNDKVMRLIAGGSLYRKDGLRFAEEDSGLLLENVPNGTPYSLEDTIVPLRGLTVEDTYSLKAKSEVVDKEVSDYLTLKYPQPHIPGPSPIEQRYHVFSPFVSKIHYDLRSGYLDLPETEGQYGDADIRRWLADYEYLLDVDPIVRGFDERYVAVHPHNYDLVMELDIYQYTFLDRAIKVYLDDKVDLTSFVKIKEGWV